MQDREGVSLSMKSEKKDREGVTLSMKSEKKEQGTVTGLLYCSMCVRVSFERE